MFGYDMSWASFHVLEVMSSPKHHQKRVGYLGAMQSFRSDTEVLMLATNLLKKVSRAWEITLMRLVLNSIKGYRLCVNSNHLSTARHTASSRNSLAGHVGSI